MSKVSNGSVLAVLGVSLLFLFGCATKPADQPAEGDRLERWLYADEEKTAEEFPEETKPARVVSLETLTSPGLSSRSEEGLPAPSYKSFILEKPARVAIEAASDAGAEIILLDRSSGELARAGKVGQEDGRIDILLDAGEYRVEVQTLRDEDPAELQVKEFVDLPVDPGLLFQSPPGTLHIETLKDYQACSFWVTLDDDETIILEALGRNLRDLVIWKDGLWRLPETFQLSEYAPQPGRTMGYAEVYLTPGAGNYLITLYGGEPRVWEDGSEEEPLYIRYGYKDLGSVVDAHTRISPMGRDAFLVSGEATVFEVENPDFVPVTLGVSEGTASRRFYSQNRATLEKDSESTRAMLTLSNSYSQRLIFLQGTPGDSVRLRAIPSREYYYIEDPPKGARYLVSSISSLDADHSVDATAIVVRAGDGRTTRDEVIHSSHLTVTPEEPLHREVNTRGEVTFVVNLTAPGKWALLRGDDNQKLEVAFAPLRDLYSVEAPVFLQGNPAVADLEAGIYLVTLWTDRPGILEYVLYYSGDRNPRGNERKARELLEEPAPLPRRDITFITERSEIIPGREHVVIMNSRGGPLHALAVEELPLTLENPVPLTLEGGESIDLPLRPHTRGSLSTGYGAIELLHRGQPLDETAVLEAETTTVTLRNTDSSPVTFVLRLDPVMDLSYNPPEVPELLSLFPNLVPDKPIYFTSGPSETKHFILQTDRSGFFELQTTGRLTTRITVRTPVLPQGPQAESNGPGRNALVQSFFRPGTYLVAVETLGFSEGRAGLVMDPLPMKDLGSLRENTWYRTSLDKGTGVTGTLNLREPGRFSFSSFGLYGSLPIRVEDADGWPIVSDLYHPGVYRLYAWPQDVSHRRLTGYFRVPPAEELPEQGPWPLALNGSRRRVWMETPERKAQEFLLSSPATIPVELSLDGNMSWSIVDSQGNLWREDKDGSSFELPAGDYRVLVKNRETGNRVSYTLAVRTRVLADGLEQRTVTIPAEFPVVLDRPGICELWSFGSRDVRARLFTENGERELAAGDDREGDWNFFLSRYLPAGRYRLVVEDSFSRSSRDVTIGCRLREEVWTEEQTLPLEEVLRIDKDIIGIPFSSGTGGLTVFSCDSSSIQLSLYRDEELLAEGTGEVVVPLLEESVYLLRLRNNAPEPVDALLSLDRPEVRTVQWDGRTPFNPSPGATVLLRPDPPSVKTETPGLFISGMAEVPAQSLPGEVLPVSGDRIWCWNTLEEPGSLSPFSLEAGDKETFLLGEEDVKATLELTESAVYVLEAHTMDAYLGIDLLPPGEEEREPRWFSSDVVDGNSVIGFAGPVSATVRFWDGLSLPKGRRVQTHLASYDLKESYSLEEAQNLTVEKTSAVRVDTGTAEYLRLLLSPGMTAFTEKGSGEIRTAAARGDNRELLLPAGDGALYLVNTGVREGYARLEAADEPPAYSLSSGELLEFPPGERVTRAIRLEATGGGEETEVFVWAADEAEVVLFTAAGRRVTARWDQAARRYNLPLVSGVVEITAGPGPAALWAEEAEDPSPPPFWMVRGIKQENRELLPGLHSLSREGERFSFNLTSEKFVIFSTESRGVSLLLPGNGAPPVTAFGAGAGRDIYALLPAGRHEFLTRPLAGEEQPFPLHVQTLEAIEVSERFSSDSVFLQPGEKVVFRVEVEEKVPVGIGVAGESDLFSAVLLGRSLETLGRGRYFYRELEAGTYYLLVENGETPMRIRPVAAGNTGSRRGVPESVIETYQGE